MILKLKSFLAVGSLSLFFSLFAGLFVFCIHMDNPGDAHIEKISIYDESNEIHIEFDDIVFKAKGEDIDKYVIFFINIIDIKIEHNNYINNLTSKPTLISQRPSKYLETIILII